MIGPRTKIETALWDAFSESWAKAYRQPCEKTKQKVWRASLNWHHRTQGAAGFTRELLVRALELLATQGQERHLKGGE